VNVSFALLFVLVAWGYGMLLSIWAVVLEEVSFRRYRRFGDLFRLLLFAALENFGYRQLTVWWRLKAFVNAAKGVHVWGDMARKGFGKPSVAALLALCLAVPCRAQGLRGTAWGSYEKVQDSQDWSTIGTQLTYTSAQGHGGWGAVEVVGRFGETDVTERIGGVVHPTQKLWVTGELGTAQEPVFLPSNTWEGDVAGLIAPRASLGLGVRHWNYPVGPVDMLMPHATIESSRMSWNVRGFVARNPTKHTDLAISLQALRALGAGGRSVLAVLASGGRENFYDGATLQVLDTFTAGLGFRYNMPEGTKFRIDATYTHSDPILTRGGVSIGVERRL
jgi:hypothetical protein